MGMLECDIPVVDMIGPNVSFISGVIFERNGDHVLVSLYLETKVGGRVTHEIVGKDAMSFGAFTRTIQNAELFIRANPDWFARDRSMN